jgi:ubiquinone biosynthesis protein
MGAFRLLRFLRMARLLLAQDALLPPDFNERAPFGLRLIRAVLTFGAPRFKAQIRGRALSDRIRKLGPTYIKLGQFLATRPDIIGLQMAADLQHLQDRLPAFAEAEMRRIIAADLDDAEKVFENIGPAVAAASIAQVHQAHKTGAPDTKLAVKVLRPRIDRQVTRDLATFRVIARWIEKLMPTARRLRPVDAIDTLARSLEAETDLRREAAALEEMAYNAHNDAGFCVPGVVWEGTGRRVLTMAWIDGIPASDVDALRAAGLDLPDLATRLLRIFLTHALRDGFFHADMHQGNLLIQTDATIVGIDLGITGRLDSDSRRFLAEILHGFITRDYRKVARVHLEAGYVPKRHSVEDFAQALRSIGEPIRDLDASEISMSRLLTQLFDVTDQFDMATQPQLLLLQKTMVTVEGVARSFDPTLNIWEAAEPVVSTWIRKQLGPEALIRDIAEAARPSLQAALRLPETLAQLERAGAALEEMAAREAAAPPKTTPTSARLVWLAVSLAVSLSGAALLLHLR